MSNLSDLMEQVRKLKNGVGVQSLLDDAYKILGNPIVMFNTEYSLMAYTDVVTDDPIWNEIIANGSFSKEAQRFFENEGFIEEAANSSKIAMMKSDKLKYDRMCGKVFNKNYTHVSNLVLLACNKPFEEYDPMAFEAVCRFMSKEISRSEFYEEYEQAHQEAIIRNLIDGNYDIKLDIGQVGIIYSSLESNLYTMVVDISLCDPEYTNIVHFRDLFRQVKPTYKHAIYSNHILMIISTNDDTLGVNKEFSSLIKIFEQNNMYAGISSQFENLFELQKYYIQAVNSMQFALEVRSSQRIFPCDKRSIGKMEQIKKLTNGQGIQYFLNIGPEIFGNPLLFHDMELNLLAYTQDVEIADPIWQELITYGTSSDETIDLFRTSGFINIMENTKGGAYLISEEIKYDRISWRIYSNDNIMVGCLSIVNSMSPFTEDELILFGAFSQKFSREVGKIEFYNNYGRVYSGTVINRLINGKIDDHTFYSEDIGNLYDDLMDNLYFVVVDTSQCALEQANLTYFRDLFNWPGAVTRYAIHGNYIIIIISIDVAPLKEKDEFKEIGKAFEQNNIFAGISSCFGNIYESQKYYIEAVNALTDGLKDNGQHAKQWIFLHDDARSANH